MRLGPKYFFTILLLVFLGLQPVACLADRIVVVVSRDATVDSLNAKQVADHFLGNTPESSPINTPFDRDDFVLKGHFYRQVAGMSLNRLRAYWAKKVFTGRGRPPRVISPDMIDDGSVFGDSFITYMYEGEVTDALKVVYALEAEVE